MFMDTLWVANAIPRIYLPPVEAYRTTALTKILPVFDNLEPEAEAVTEAEFERLCAQAAGPDFHGDLSELAERATDYGQEYGGTMFAIRQSVLNLLAAGLFHLFEQQQKGLFHQTVAARTGTNFSWDALDNSLAASGVDRRQLPGAASLEELRLVANTIKHGAGGSAAKLAALRPDLFDFDPDGNREEDVDRQRLSATMQASDLLFAPLGGGDLYVTEENLADWCDAVLQFWRGLAAELRVSTSPRPSCPSTIEDSGRSRSRLLRSAGDAPVRRRPP